MIIKRASNKLTSRDLDIMNILWNSEEPQTASEIVKNNPELTTNTVQAVVRKLLKQNLIEVADIVYSGTVLCRSYRTTVSANDFALSEFATEFKTLNQEIATSSLIAALLDMEKDPEKTAKEIEDLENLLKEYKEQHSKGISK